MLLTNKQGAYSFIWYIEVFVEGASEQGRQFLLDYVVQNVLRQECLQKFQSSKQNPLWISKNYQLSTLEEVSTD